ncbi:APC family permease [Peribacillus sp. NPDC058002]|uniref:APC family permease n=1 Tax=Peribacillus sp. NPDC058002 TaxID=3346301 RepID=UPI0036D7E88D
MEKKRVSFKRTLTLSHVILFGLAYMTPMVVFGTYGVMAELTKGIVPVAYIIALTAMLFTAYSYGEMVKAYPVSGSAYTYTRKSISPQLGFLIGWSVLLDYLFLPMVIWLIGSVYLNAAFPSVPSWVWIVAFIVLTTTINLIGTKVMKNVNLLMMAFQLLVLVLFLVLCSVNIIQGTGVGTLFSMEPFMSGDASFSLLLAGASVACYSFLGFDAVSTLSEETINPKKTIPKAILLITFIGGGIFILSSYFLYLVFPHYTEFQNIDSAAFEIARLIGGNLFSALFLAGLIIAQFASGLTAQTSAARLMLAMGRDSVLPKKLFGYIHPASRTPVFNLFFIGCIALLALTFDITTSTSFINFGAFATFIFVNLSVITHYYVKGKKRGGKHFVLYLLLPAIGASLDIWLFLNLDKNALILGSLWAAIGFIYLLFLTKFFKKQPPEINFEEAEEAV